MMTRRLFLAAAPGAALAAGDTVVWRAGEGGYHTYRIPAAVRSKKGTLLAFCEGRREGSGDSGDIDLLLKRSSDNGTTWSDTEVLADLGTDTVGNPAPVVDRRDGAIHLLLTRNPGKVKEKEIIEGTTTATRTVWATVSHDDGRSWDPPREITREVKAAEWTWYATGPCNGIQLRSGRLIVPCDHVTPDKQMWSHVVYSDDGGNVWKTGGTAGPQCNECTVAELSDGTLLLNMRSYSGKHRRAVSRSRDGGQTWSPPEPDEALVEPVCQASLIRAGKRLVFSNPASEKRENMTVKVSNDNGRTWRVLRVVHPGPSAYSNLVDLGGNRAGLLYERGGTNPYESIVWTTVSL
jgi:sialidase-1